MKNILQKMGMVVIITLAFILNAQAQLSNSSDNSWTSLIFQEGQWTRVLTGTPPAGLNTAVLEDYTSEEWKALRSQLLKTIHRGEGAEWEQAVQQTIFLALFFNNKINLNRASLDLMQSYNLDRNEAHRVLALTAIHAIGHQNIMSHLAQRVNTEGSKKVRSLTIAALADYYGMKDFYGRRLVITPTVKR